MSRWILAAALVLGAMSGCASPVVGAECAPGYTACDGECVLTDSDPAHCGGCGNVCPSGICIDGTCAGDPPFPDGGEPDMGDAGGLDGGVADAGPERPDFGPPPECACNLGERCCEGRCVGTDFEPADCGECGNVCSGDDVCSAGVCQPACTDGLTLCRGLCLDLSSDPNNCGSCGNVCETGICIDGECAIGFPGHVVLVGHDYATNRVGMNRVAGNALFTSFRPEVRVVTYEGSATRMTIRGVDRAIDQVAAERGRSWTKTAATAEDVPFELGSADAFIIYPQAAGPTDEELQAAAELWSVALEAFTLRGGVVVAFDGAAQDSSDHSGTWQMLAAARVLDAGGRADVTGDEVTLADPSDSVALGVPIRYLAQETSVRFETSDLAEQVVSHPDGPVVLHRTVVP